MVHDRKVGSNLVHNLEGESKRQYLACTNNAWAKSIGTRLYIRLGLSAVYIFSLCNTRFSG